MTDGVWDILLPAAQEKGRRDIISVLILVGHGSMTYDSAWVQLMDIKTVLVSRVLACRAG
jgi:hypothetical protein